MKEVGIILNSPSEIANVTEKDVIYADGGVKHFQKDKNVVAVVGDFDTGKEIEGVKTVKLQKEKDFTDGEMAIKVAGELGYEKATIYGATGGKIEHILFNFSLLKIAKGLGIECRIVEKECDIELVFGEFAKKVKKGASVSLYPFTDECVVKESYGLYYPLKNLKLIKSDTVGISNQATEEEIGFKVETGEVLAIIYK